MLTWLKDPNPAGLFMFLALLSLFAAGVVIALPSKASEPVHEDPAAHLTTNARAVNAMIKHLVKGAPRHPAARKTYRHEWSREIAKAATKHEIPVELVTAIVYRESSIRTSAIGKSAGELGAMQVHPMTAIRHKCKMIELSDQLDCGCKILAHWKVKCGGEWDSAVSAYGSKGGVCNPEPGGSLARMVKDRLALADELRTVADAE